MTHLRINHFPVALTVVALGMLILALIFRRRFLWMYAITTGLLAGIAVVPTYLTGDPAAEEVRNSWYISRAAVAAHDQSASISLGILGVTGLVCLYALWRAVRAPLPPASYRDLSLAGWLKTLVGVAILASAVSAGYTGYLGGEIVHGSAQLPFTKTAPAGAPGQAGPGATAPAGTSSGAVVR